MSILNINTETTTQSVKRELDIIHFVYEASKIIRKRWDMYANDPRSKYTKHFEKMKNKLKVIEDARHKILGDETDVAADITREGRSAMRAAEKILSNSAYGYGPSMDFNKLYPSVMLSDFGDLGSMNWKVAKKYSIIFIYNDNGIRRSYVTSEIISSSAISNELMTNNVEFKMTNICKSIVKGGGEILEIRVK